MTKTMFQSPDAVEPLTLGKHEMKTNSLLIFLTVATAWPALAQMREWKSSAGSTVKAEFVELKDGKAILKTIDGLIAPPLTALTEESLKLALSLGEKQERQRLAKLTPAQKASVIDPRNYTPPKNTLVSTFTSPEFDAYLYEPSGRCEIFVKENGAFLSEPLSITLAVQYRNPAKPVNQQDVQRPVLKLLEPPQYKNGLFTVKQLRQDDVTSEIQITVKKGVVTAGYQVTDPPEIKLPSRGYLVFGPRPVYAMPTDKEGFSDLAYSPRVSKNGVSRQAILDLVAPWKVTFRPKAKQEGVGTSFSYSVPIDRFPAGALDSITLTGGMYGPRKATLTPLGKGSLVAWIYQGRAPMEGYSIHYIDPQPTAAPTPMMKLEIQ